MHERLGLTNKLQPQDAAALYGAEVSATNRWFRSATIRSAREAIADETMPLEVFIKIRSDLSGAICCIPVCF